MRPLVLLLSTLSISGCNTTKDTGEDTTPAMAFGHMGSLSGESGQGSFRFGASTAATQIEDQNTHTDWHYWTLPTEDGGAGFSTPIGEAVQGYSKAIDDIQLMKEMNLDAYRFSLSWSRIEPSRDTIDEEALQHYGDFLSALRANNIEPMVTVHHFANPFWTYNFIDGCPDSGWSDDNLCGWADPEGAEQIIEEIEEYGAMIATRYGDRVDEWCTLNEPVNYLLASYGMGVFPPGESNLLGNFDRLVVAIRNMMEAHSRLYDAIKANDTIDADGDGVAAHVGLSLSIADWVPVRDGELSDHPDDVAAANNLRYIYHHVFPESFLNGTFDNDFDGTVDEEHPTWQNKLDWLGLQYYFRAGVTGKLQLLPAVNGMICLQGFEDLSGGSCLNIPDQTKWVPSMGYEFYEPGFGALLEEYATTYPSLPLVVTESGIATEVGERRAENIVRSLEQIANAQAKGADIRGYYHWSLTDNFEWAEGYEPQFGLYEVDRNNFERSPTLGATLLGDIANQRELSSEMRDTYGGTGPMTPEEHHVE